MSNMFRTCQWWRPQMQTLSRHMCKYTDTWPKKRKLNYAAPQLKGRGRRMSTYFAFTSQTYKILNISGCSVFSHCFISCLISTWFTHYGICNDMYPFRRAMLKMPMNCCMDRRSGQSNTVVPPQRNVPQAMVSRWTYQPLGVAATEFSIC